MPKIATLDEFWNDVKHGVYNFTKDGKCVSCGNCCTAILPVTKEEIKAIKRYIKRKHIKPVKNTNVDFDLNGKEWLHVSFSRKSKMPTYADLQLVKREFIGNDKKAIMVFPEEENYVNIHPNCLHLWYSSENPIPEFSEGKGTI